MQPFQPANRMHGWQAERRPLPLTRRRHFLGTPARLGQEQLGLGFTVSGLLGLAFSGAVAYSGIYTGSRAKGFAAVVGWTAGVLGILGGLGTVLTLAGVAVYDRARAAVEEPAA